MSKLLKGYNDLATLYPELVSEWDFDKNELLPNELVSHSAKGIWWKCSLGHSWYAPVHSRTGNNRSGCPYCSNRKTLAGYNDLATIFPELVHEWNYNRNIVTPNEIAPRSGKKVWWICSKGHEWEATVHSRTSENPTGCPYCSNKRVLKGYNDLATTNPELITEWCYSKNTHIQPESVSFGSKNKVAWQCNSCSHIWYAAIYERTRGRGCPVCSKKKGTSKSNKTRLSQRGSIVTNSPELLAEWNYNRNSAINPETILCGSEQKVWWICSKGHEWLASVKDRKKNNCPYCSNKKALPGYNDLATINPQLANEWHPTRNSSLSPLNVTAGSNKNVWWMCKKGHEWKATINSRNQGRGCRICSEEISTSFPEQAVFFYIKELYPSAINRYDKEGFEIDIFIPQYEIGIEYDGQYYHESSDRDNKKDAMASERGITLIRIREPKCPELNGSSVRIHREDMSIKGLETAIIETISYIGMLTGNNSCINVSILRDEIEIENLTEKTYKPKSLMSMYPEISVDWNNEKNGYIKPEQISYGSKKNVWWKCHICGYEWKTSPNSRTNGNEKNRRGCPVCSKKHMIEKLNRHFIISNGSLQEKDPSLSEEWDYDLNIGLTPNQVTLNSKKKVWWICSKGHRWQATIDNRARGHGCPYCSNKKVLDGYNDLLTINPTLASEWDYKKNGSLKPNMVTVGSGKIIWWKCKNGHEWQASVHSRARTGCPICSKSFI